MRLENRLVFPPQALLAGLAGIPRIAVDFDPFEADRSPLSNLFTGISSVTADHKRAGYLRRRSSTSGLWRRPERGDRTQNFLEQSARGRDGGWRFGNQDLRTKTIQSHGNGPIHISSANRISTDSVNCTIPLCQDNTMKLFKGKVALVTGAGGGIGLATANAFAEAGAAVTVADSNATLLHEAADGLRSAGHDVLAVPCDVTERNQVAAMIDQTVAKYGRLDAAFNNAGINSDGAPLHETSDDEFDKVLDVNLRGVWNCMKAELRQMLSQGSGAIVNCSSIGGMRGSKGRTAYSASKFGVIGLTRAAALDYAAKNIRINAVCPGIIGNTPMATRVTKNNDPDIIKAFVAAEPIGRLGEPKEIAAAVIWLCSPAASFMIGHAMAIDGGILA
jgi:NAD(P)-dependent dehydrogenase (short-subunit alcohol dehydrogenase family)